VLNNSAAAMTEQLQMVYQGKAKELESIAAFMQDVKVEMQSLNANRQKFVSQYEENTMAKEELELLADDASIFKQIGPALVKQEKAEALDTVNKRLDFIRSTLEGVEKELAAKQASVEKKNTEATSIQRELQALQQKFQQMQIQQQQQQQQAQGQ
jgi:prefoldin beta subunit